MTGFLQDLQLKCPAMSPEHCLFVWTAGSPAELFLKFLILGIVLDGRLCYIYINLNVTVHTALPVRVNRMR